MTTQMQTGLIGSLQENFTEHKKSFVELDLLQFISETIETWQIHRCQVTYALISQHEPMKLIYHYEQLSSALKEQYPLNGRLLKDFDKLMNRADFAKLLGINENQVANPWQLKFTGKLVVFNQNPEIALRLQWTNTLKSFEPVYALLTNRESPLENAIERAFVHWQFIDTVEVVNKNPALVLTATLEKQHQPWQLLSNQHFVELPSVIALSIQQFLHTQPHVIEHWLNYIQSSAIDYACENLIP